MSHAEREFDKLGVGDQASLSRRYGEGDIRLWNALADAGTFTATVPEPLIAALFSNLLGEHLPGNGTNYLKQRMVFHDHARADEVLTAAVTVIRLRPEKALVNLKTVCHGRGGRLICEGEALVLFDR